VRAIVCAATLFGEYLQRAGIVDPADIDERLVARFLADLQSRGSFRGVPRAIRVVLEHLREKKVLSPPRRKQEKLESSDVLLRKYETYLVDVRAVARSTIQEYSRGGRRFLEWLRRRRRRLRSLRGRDVLRFIEDLAGERPTRSWRNRITSQTRLFLRFLYMERIIGNDLAPAVPKLRYWRLAAVPRHLSWDDVRKLIRSVDTKTSTGKRDKAILLLIARLGMRGEEVRTLETRHVAWREGEIRLPRTKSQRAKILPLPKDVGAALAEYVLHGRPRASSQTIFLRHAAPQAELSKPSAVSQIVSRCLERARIQHPGRPGVHLLRHSLATRMVNSGVPIKQIADVLGHRSINTTAIYTKVDMTTLSDVALPFPTARPTE
jgi:site-specific recombinase XerD